MGFLCNEAPLTWDESLAVDLRSTARAQLLRRCADAPGDPTVWGDEVEYTVLHVGHENDAPRLKLGAQGLVAATLPSSPSRRAGEYMVEYASWMVEGVPAQPYEDLWSMEDSLRARREEVESAVRGAGGEIRTLSCFPLMGHEAFYEPYTPPGGPLADSATASDACITPVPRFQALTRNIRTRRGRKVDVRVPLAGGGRESDDLLHLDAMLYGMGCCSLQITTQAASLAHASALHDAFAVIAPWFLALSAATPAVAGRLADTDTRWELISQSVDDRTEKEERGEKSNLPPRFGCADLFLAGPPGCNDVPLARDEPTYEALLGRGTPEPLARYMAHVLSRDPLVVYPTHVSDPDPDSVAAMETFLSTHWKTVRVKPPGPSVASWRVEFRPMELQPTDFENAALGTVALLCARALVHFGRIPYLPVSRLREAVSRASARDAVHTQRFVYRDLDRPVPLAEIFDGEEDGLLTLCRKYLAEEAGHGGRDGRVDLPPAFEAYAKHVSDLASGRLPTVASRLRRVFGEDGEEGKVTAAAARRALDTVLGEKIPASSLIPATERTMTPQRFEVDMECVDMRAFRAANADENVRPAYGFLGMTEEEKTAYARAHLFDYMVPRRAVVVDRRGKEDSSSPAPTLDGDAFQLVHAPTALAKEDLASKEAMQGYLSECRDHLKRLTGASVVIPFDYVLRTGEAWGADEFVQRGTYCCNRPHNDHTFASARKRIHDLLPPPYDTSFEGKRYGIFNAWRRWDGGNAWPLACARFETVDRDKDLVPCDLVYSHRCGHTFNIDSAANIEYGYFSDMTQDELLVFKIYDTEEPAFCVHTGVQNPTCPDDPPRVSIEVRCILLWDEESASQMDETGVEVAHNLVTDHFAKFGPGAKAPA